MDRFTEMFSGINVGQLLLVVFFCVLAVGAFLLWRKGKKKYDKEKEVKPLVIAKEVLANNEKVTTIIDHPEKAKPSIQLGVGKLRCYVISESRPDYFTTIKEPVGNVFVAETSMPQSGQCYLVKEWADGFVEDYDPRMVEYNDKETPQKAYRATHWEVAQAVFHVEGNFWGKINPWWAVGIIGVFILIAMLVFGG